jgi:Ca2+-dependent lipid-binding protein
VARVYRVTGALYVSIGLWTMVAFLQGVSLKLAQESIHLDSIVLLGQKSSWLLSALFFGDASLDIVMASVLIYYLTQQKRTAFKR